MAYRTLIIASLLLLPYLSIAQKTDKKTIKSKIVSVTYTITEDDITPPPAHLVSKFTSLEGWFTDICKNDRPKKSISTYNISLFESPGEYTLGLTGVNTYDRGNHSRIKIEFEPKNMFFPLPKTYIKNLNRDQVLKKLINELTIFSKTATFQKSFFVQADHLVFDSTGAKIWSKY